MTLIDKVYLQLGSRDDTDNAATNRVALKCESIGISTAKNVLAFPIPASGFITGESVNLGVDLGMATKTVNLTGIITDQIIYKQFGKDSLKNASNRFYLNSSGFAEVRMTSHEVAQLIHSYVDSSFVQSHQNFNELVILYPSFVGEDYNYHPTLEPVPFTTQAEVDALDETTAPLVPFNYGVRTDGDGVGFSKNELDGKGTVINTSKIGPVYSGTGDVKGMKGFIRQFNTTFNGGNPFIDFTIDFEVAITGL